MARPDSRGCGPTICHDRYENVQLGLEAVRSARVARHLSVPKCCDRSLPSTAKRSPQGHSAPACGGFASLQYWDAMCVQEPSVGHELVTNVPTRPGTEHPEARDVHEAQGAIPFLEHCVADITLPFACQARHEALQRVRGCRGHAIEGYVEVSSNDGGHLAFMPGATSASSLIEEVEPGDLDDHVLATTSNAGASL